MIQTLFQDQRFPTVIICIAIKLKKSTVSFHFFFRSASTIATVFKSGRAKFCKFYLGELQWSKKDLKYENFENITSK